jgi:hypothetical protein
MSIINYYMKQVQLRELLERYYSALTTQEEEQLLMELLSSDDLSPEFHNERDALLTLMGLTTRPEPDHLFESRMESLLFKEAGTSGSTPAAERNRFRRIYITLMSSAAAIILAVSAWFIIANRSEPADSFSSPQLAYEETLRTLQKVSSEMNRATSKLKPLESMEIAEKSIRNAGVKGRLIDQGFTELEEVQKALTGKGLTIIKR